MLRIKCPVCSVEGEETDFHYGHEAHIARPATSDPDNISDAQQADYLFMRRNPKGLHFERWRCDRGCGKWFHAARDTIGRDIFWQIPNDYRGEWAAFFADKLAARSN